MTTLDIQEVSRDDPFASMDLTPVREWLRISHTDEDDALKRYMAAAERQASTWCHASMAQTTLKLTIEDFNTNKDSRGNYAGVELPRGPVSSVTDITDGTTTVTTGLVLDNRMPQRLTLPDSLQGNGDVEIVVEYVAGYASWTAMPGQIQHLLLLAMAQMYTQRQPVVGGGSVSDVPWTLSAAIAGSQREPMP
tara:strand:+ start:949 stop:1527 length:579 start_codon:yes stop_codon:yes gene_type:complete